MGAEAGQRQGEGQGKDQRAEHPCAAAMSAPAVVVHGPADVAAVLAAAGPRGVVLLSTPGAAGSLGAAWFLAMVERGAMVESGARAGGASAVPSRDACWFAVLDCGDAPGHALAALRAGARRLILDPGCPAFAAVAAAAAEVGATLWAARPSALDLGRMDTLRPYGQRLLAAWLAGGPVTAD